MLIGRVYLWMIHRYNKAGDLVLFDREMLLHVTGLQLLRLKGRLDYNFTHIQMSVRVLRVRHCDRIVSSYP
jgi:hypothetical protein